MSNDSRRYKSEVGAQSDSQRSEDYRRYLGKLFYPTEYICVGDSVQVTESDHAININVNQPANFVCLNPLRGRRSDANVASFRNFLIEMDQGTIEEQLAEIVDKKVPYTSLVYSGGKSVHAVIALTEGVTREEYAEIFEMLKIVLPGIDPTSRNPSRLTRAAGAVRETADGPVNQELIDLRKRVTRDRLISWLSGFSGLIERTLAEREEAREARERLRNSKSDEGESGLSLLSPTTLAFLNGEATINGSRHARLVGTAFELRDCGVPYEEALQLLSKAADLYGITADPKRVNEAEEVATYAYSKS